LWIGAFNDFLNHSVILLHGNKHRVLLPEEFRYFTKLFHHNGITCKIYLVHQLFVMIADDLVHSFSIE
jgi:hypothetical protein